jgi:hypothetical protein
MAKPASLIRSATVLPYASEGIHAFQPENLLTPEELAQRLKVATSWVFEQTRQRAKVRKKKPLPCIRLGKYLRFDWPAVCDWMTDRELDTN